MSDIHLHSQHPLRAVYAQDADLVTALQALSIAERGQLQDTLLRLFEGDELVTAQHRRQSGR